MTRERRWVLLKIPRCDIDGERERWFILKSSEAINKGVVNTSNHRDIEPTQQRKRCQKPIPEVFVDGMVQAVGVLVCLHRWGGGEEIA